MRSCQLLIIAVIFWSCQAAGQFITLAFISDPSGATLTGSGTASGVLTMGTVQAFGGSTPAGISKTTTANSWILSTPIDVQVQKVGLITSSSYTLNAQLLLSDAQHTWKWNSITLSTSSATITSSGVYGTTPYNFSLTIPFSSAAGTIINTVNITAISN